MLFPISSPCFLPNKNTLKELLPSLSHIFQFPSPSEQEFQYLYFSGFLSPHFLRNQTMARSNQKEKKKQKNLKDFVFQVWKNPAYEFTTSILSCFPTFPGNQTDLKFSKPEQSSYLLVHHEYHRHHMLKWRRFRIEIRPQVILQILTHFQNHNPLQRHSFASAWDHQLRLVNLLHQLRVERLLGLRVFARFGPVGLCYLGEPITLDFEKSYGVGDSWAGFGLGYLVSWLNWVLGDPMALEVVSSCSVHLRHCEVTTRVRVLWGKQRSWNKMNLEN